MKKLGQFDFNNSEYLINKIKSNTMAKKKTAKKQAKNKRKTAKKQVKYVYIDRKTRKRIKVIPFSETVTWEERKLVVPLIVERIKRENKFGQAISNPHIVNSLYKHEGIKVSEPTIRKLIHYIRVNGILKNLIAGHFGYYTTRDPKKIINYLKKLNKMQKEIGIFKKAIETQTKKIVTRYNKKTKK